MSVTYTAVLPVCEHTVLFLSGLLHAERRRLGTRAGTRSLGCYRQAILVLRWLLDGTRIRQLATDNQHQPVDRLRLPARGHHRARRPGSRPAIGAARGEDGRLRPCQHRRHADRDRPVPHSRPDPRRGSLVVGKARQPRRERAGHHRPGRLAALDLTRASRPRTRHHRPASHDILPLLTTWTDDDLRVLGDLGYEGEQATITVAFKKPKNRACTAVQQQFNRAHNAVRAIGERGNSLLKTTFKALRNVSLCPWTIGRITAAALVILHIEHGRTT